MADALKPCPFCGGESRLESCQGVLGSHCRIYKAGCERCRIFVSMPYSDYAQWEEQSGAKNMAIERWNARPESPPERNPDVLMRALELAVDYMSGDDKEAQLEVVKEFIEDAICELESEAGNGTTQAHD